MLIISPIYEGVFNELTSQAGPTTDKLLDLHVGFCRAGNKHSAVDSRVHEFLALFMKSSADGKPRDARRLNSVVRPGHVWVNVWRAEGTRGTSPTGAVQGGHQDVGVEAATRRCVRAGDLRRQGGDGGARDHEEGHRGRGRLHLVENIKTRGDHAVLGLQRGRQDPEALHGQLGEGRAGGGEPPGDAHGRGRQLAGDRAELRRGRRARTTST